MNSMEILIELAMVNLTFVLMSNFKKLNSRKATKKVQFNDVVASFSVNLHSTKAFIS